MYGGAGGPGVTTTGAGVGLAATGFTQIGMLLLGLAAVLVALGLFRTYLLRRASS